MTSHLRSRLVACGLMAVGLAALPARAAIMYGTTVGSGGAGPSTLLQIDPSTGLVLNTIGSVGYAVNGLEYAGGKLYGSTTANDPNFPSGLIEINPLTGAGTPIGTGFGSTDMVVVAITSNSSGTLYGWHEPNVDDLALIDPVTGLASWVGDSGLDTGALGLAFNGSGTLFLVNYDGPTYSVNPGTGAATFLYNLDTTAHHGDFNPDNGLYYGLRRFPDQGDSQELVVANLGTGTVLTLPTADLHAVTFVVVPEPGEVAMVFGIAALGFGGLRRWTLRGRK